VEFDLGEALDFLDRHDKAHPEPVERCSTCAPILLKKKVMDDLERELGRKPTRAELNADPRMIADAARTAFDSMRFAQAFRK
jgi:hypothetical protein